MTTAIIADDERNLAEHLQRQLGTVWPSLTIQGIANNGPEALSLIQQHQPDIAFLDIRMPGMSQWHLLSGVGLQAMSISD